MNFKLKSFRFHLKSGTGWRFGGHSSLGLACYGWRAIRRRKRLAPAVPTCRRGRGKSDPRRPFKEDTVPAEFRPYVEVELHAKVSGYVKDMNVDFGDKVKAGELLATLEVPELRDELTNAMAREAEDGVGLHQRRFDLYPVAGGQPAIIPTSSPQQDLDTAQANDLAAAAAIAAAKADVEKYQTLVGYTQITAPFDGVVTHRYADPGALIQAGTSSDTQSLPLVRVSDNYLLRLDFPVTVDYVKDIQVGDPVEVRVDSLNGKTFTGTISRFTDDVNQDTRTMTTEIEVPNPDLKVVPGMYATMCSRSKSDRRRWPFPPRRSSPASRPPSWSSIGTTKSSNAMSLSASKRPTNTKSSPVCRRAIWWSSATVPGCKPARKSSPNLSSFLCAMKIEMKPFDRSVSFRPAIVFLPLKHAGEWPRRPLWFPSRLGRRKFTVSARTP